MRIYTFLLLFSVTLNGYGQADVWEAVVTDGFGDLNNMQISELHEFKGKLFATTSCRPPKIADMWYSATGDAGTWTKVTSYSPAIHPSISQFPSLSHTDLGGGIMYLGMGSDSIGSMIYRSTDGISWTGITPAGFGTPDLSLVSPNMTVFQGSADSIPYLYAGLGDWDGVGKAELWRIPYNTTNPGLWEKLMDFDTVATSIPDTADIVSFMQVWNDKLYFTTSGNAQLWETADGKIFTRNTGVDYGFGVPSNKVISCMRVYHDTLFAATTNKLLGGQMYRSGDGINWENVTEDAFGDSAASEELHSFDVGHGYLWITAYTDTAVSAGCPIWRSDDGWNFVQSNADGFGNPDINGANAVTAHFGSYQYFGGPNYVDGAQIWRTEVTPVRVTAPTPAAALRVFPRPATGWVRFELPTGIQSLEIFALDGKMLSSYAPGGATGTAIDTDGLPRGLHLYVLYSSAGERYTGKLILR